MERRTVTGAAAIHATSDLRRRISPASAGHCRKVAVIPNGVDPPLDATGQPVSADVAAAIGRGDYVLSLGRIVWKKGLDRLIAALPAVPTARLVLAGDDTEAHVAFLLREATRLAVADRVTILARHVEGADKESLFAAARAFAMPSLSENFGIAAVEAMRRGSPVLVTPEVGVADLVRKSGGGIVVAGEPAAVARGLNLLLADPAASQGNGGGRPRLCQRALRLVVGRRKHEDLYETLLSTRG